jgi:hypothetical protein
MEKKEDSKIQSTIQKNSKTTCTSCGSVTTGRCACKNQCSRHRGPNGMRYIRWLCPDCLIECPHPNDRKWNAVSKRYFRASEYVESMTVAKILSEVESVESNVVAEMSSGDEMSAIVWQMFDEQATSANQPVALTEAEMAEIEAQFDH